MGSPDSVRGSGVPVCAADVAPFGMPARYSSLPRLLFALLALALAGCGGAGSTTGGAGSAVGGAGSTARSGAAGSTLSGASDALPGALPRMTKATLILDFTPNAVHAGIYRALAAGYYRRENIDLQVVQPGATVEPLSLVGAGRAQFGLADGSDVANEISHGGHDEAIAAIVQQPLGGLIALASAHLSSPAQLQGGAGGLADR